MCDTIYKGKSQQIFKRIMDSHFFDPTYYQKLTKIIFFSYHYEQHFKSTASRIDQRYFMLLKLVNNINTIRAIKAFMKPNFTPCMEERLTILKRYVI